MDIAMYMYVYNLPCFKVQSKCILINSDILEPVGNDIFHSFAWRLWLHTERWEMDWNDSGNPGQYGEVGSKVTWAAFGTELSLSIDQGGSTGKARARVSVSNRLQELKNLFHLLFVAKGEIDSCLKCFPAILRFVFQQDPGPLVTSSLCTAKSCNRDFVPVPNILQFIFFQSVNVPLIYLLLITMTFNEGKMTKKNCLFKESNL